MYTETEREERMKLIRRMYEAGDSTTKIGREIGISHQTVRNWLKADGIKLKRPRNGKKLPCDVKKLKELAAKGLTKQEISDRMKVSRTTVSAWLYETGTTINTEARKAGQQEKKKQGAGAFAAEAEKELQNLHIPLHKSELWMQLRRSDQALQDSNMPGNRMHGVQKRKAIKKQEE